MVNCAYILPGIKMPLWEASPTVAQLHPTQGMGNKPGLTVLPSPGRSAGGFRDGHFNARILVWVPSKRGSHRQCGYILVQALVVLAGLLALLAMLAADGRVANQAVQNRLRQRRAEAAGDAALARALAVVQGANSQIVTLQDDWAKLGDGGNEQFTLGDATFRVQLIDAGALVNVNHAPSDQLTKLTLTRNQVEALLDWRESKAGARPGGAKDAYYHSLPTPYNAALAPLATMDELLLVKGWTVQTLYQAPPGSGETLTDQQGQTLPLAAMVTADGGTPNVGAGGQPRINLAQPGIAPNVLMTAGIRQDLAMQIASQAPYTGFSALLAAPGVDAPTAALLLDTAGFTEDKRLEGKTNLNTAPLGVLKTLPNITPVLADAIAARQAKDAQGFHRLSELAELRGMDQAKLAQVADAFTVGGDTWIVRAYGTSGGLSVPLEAIVGLRDGRAQVITRTRLNTTGIPTWWGWAAETTSTGDAGDAL